ncbi:snaclec bothrojaracin subunit beta-like [Lytechinus pictus]|uniref:snaclec bothrojaracin subunit beta-like n=1 Tax=Lytechinus pictus TaxID=7653 RepID=UPI0030BA2AA5
MELALFRHLKLTVRLIVPCLILCFEMYYQTFASCPVGWDFWRGGCYQFQVDNGALPWQTGDEVCNDLGGWMVVVRSVEEWEVVDNLIRRNATVDNGTLVWNGCHSDVILETVFTCNDGFHMQYADWDSNEPPMTSFNETTNKNVTIIAVQSGKWKVTDPNSTGYIVCFQPAFDSVDRTTVYRRHITDSHCLIGQNLAKYSGTTRKGCAIYCLRTSGCRSFNHKGKSCYLNSNTRHEVNSSYFQFVSSCNYFEPMSIYNQD